MALHKDSTVGNVHIIYNWTYADTAAREAATGLVAGDVGKFCRQLDDNAIWMLTDDDPVTWVCMKGFANPMTAAGDIIYGGVDGAPTALPKGTAGQVLAMNTGATAPEWKAASTGTVVRQTIFTFSGDLEVESNPLRIYNELGISQTISKVFLSVGTAPAGSAIQIDIHKNGTTIFTTQTNRPEIASGATTGNTTTIDVPTWADGEYLTAHIDAIGSGTAGADLVVHIIHS